jgi:2',3'-cyclic-nucleotide 2'-phosphodiesterase (5'-nucleotidase family)
VNFLLNFQQHRLEFIRYEETSLDSGLCKSDKCIGGFSRLYATVTSLFKQKPNSILLNAGDNFEGTAWYNVHKWNITQYFLNKLPIDAFVSYTIQLILCLQFYEYLDIGKS